ncbi:protein LNK2-like [Dioscorea cayenensis subsp. rotundata]|uniref:Protein LNK2-like n=1 Tax=Dioscorea cayennensis subsp. rotundata TaxID=55577 RepID=A0AB40ASN7_DIOCR|nr:protein LNK2-like [Dioscorea cayenensis subsp. rotundata]
MFDWNEDRVGDTIWGEFSESEDHIVPYPKEGEEDTLLICHDFGKKQKNEGSTTDIKSAQQTSEDKRDLPGCDFENSSSCNANKEFSAPRLDLDSWPDLPSISAALSKGYNDENNESSLQAGLMDFSEASNLNSVRVQLEGNHELFNNEHDDREDDSFLDCDWANMGDFDDLDKIFRSNDSIFGHDIGSNADEFLSSSADVISGTAQSIPMPDIPMSRDQPSDQEFPYAFSEHSDGIRKPEENVHPQSTFPYHLWQTSDITVKTEEQMVSSSNLTNHSSGIQTQPSDKAGKQSKQVKPRKKAEDRSKNNFSQNLNGAWSNRISQSQQFPSPKAHPSLLTSVQTFQHPAISQQRQGESEHMGYPISSSQFMFSGYGFPAYSFPAIPVLPCAPAERNQMAPVVVGYKSNVDQSKGPNSSDKLPDSSKPLTMTPQEKIEKLRRRQQMQAMLAIQQQQQQFGKQISGSDSLASQACSQKNQNQDASTSTIGVEESANKILSSEIEKMKFYTSMQLDTRVKLGIRDSLFRLAKSAMERQSASDRSSTNKINREDDEVAAKI